MRDPIRWTPTLLLDGATGTEMLKRGMPSGSCTDLWILEHPDAILDLQRAYVEAGSQVLYAPTFSANRPSLERHGAKISVKELCKTLVALSREASAGKTYVAGDVAPCGLQPEPVGAASFDDLTAVFRETAEALCLAGVDLFAVETQISLLEARAAVTAVRQVSDLPLLVTFACGPTGRSLWGDDLTEAALDLQALGADAFGINCCGDLELIEALIRDVRSACALPLVVKPNAGKPENRDGRSVYSMTPQTLADFVPRFRAAGASVFGGCCGTTPEHIAAIRDALK